MNSDRYKRVKEIFLSACEKPREEREQFIRSASDGDDEIRGEVQSLLAEHLRETQLLPPEPEGPLGPMSAILSRAGIEVDAAGEVQNAGDLDASASVVLPDNAPPREPQYHDDAHDQTSATRSGFVDAGRFMAGTVVAGRYRIIELLGRGGMGEVYRADDITLNQSIALKFLPSLFGADQKWLERFRNEVRLARQVTHPNVCRVFDIGEYQGEQFISMEYVDGENLASLLRRIGRVPHDKAVLLARQLCAGLAAAHDRGVLHRDLKPANVMIDGRGSVRITDFGLAAPVDEMDRERVRAGTPAYMSPEQLAGKPVTVRSDVYSLGLVLYEMFTGRRTFRAQSLREYQKLHSSEDPTPPSEVTEDIDPIVDRVIMRCLEKDPRDRPASAMAVSAALPGGNPLREILAAGETPSPEVVAAAGEMHGAMRPRLAVALVLTAILCMIGFVYMAPQVFVVQRALDPPETARAGQERAGSPVILTHEAKSLMASLGYGEPRDWASGFEVDRDYYLHVEEDKKDTSRLWLLARPRMGMVYFWYRQSPELLMPARPDGAVAERDPSPDIPGMAKVRFDALGRLTDLELEPTPSAQSIIAGSPQSASAPAALLTVSSSAALVKPDWTPLLAAAQIDLKSFHPVDPQGALPVYADNRMAWSGVFTDLASVRSDPVRIEAASFRGKPVFFKVIGTWKTERYSEERAQVLAAGRANLVVQTVVIGGLLAAGCILAWRNYRTGRGDRQGANRMAMAFFLLGAVAWLFRAHHTSDIVFEFILFQRGMGPVLYLAALVWVFYLALEPYVRRIWPETVISWSRLLAGKWFDPLVGRDLLAGAAVGVMTTLLSVVEFQIPHWAGDAMPVPLPSITSITHMLAAVEDYSSIFQAVISSLYVGLILLLFLVLVRMMTNRRWISALAFIVLFAIATAHYRVEDQWWRLGPENWLSLGIEALLAAVLLMLLTRHGLVGVIFCLLARTLLMEFPVTWDFSVWYANASLAGILATAIILAAGFYAALGGRAPLRLRPATA